MKINHRDLLILAFVIIGLLFLAFLPIASDQWSVAKAQGTLPPTLTPTIDPRTREVPESDSVLLMGAGLAGLAIWLAWQVRKIESRRPL